MALSLPLWELAVPRPHSFSAVIIIATGFSMCSRRTPHSPPPLGHHPRTHSTLHTNYVSPPTSPPPRCTRTPCSPSPTHSLHGSCNRSTHCLYVCVATAAVGVSHCTCSVPWSDVPHPLTVSPSPTHALLAVCYNQLVCGCACLLVCIFKSLLWLLQEVDPCSAQSALSHLAPGGVVMSGGCGHIGSSLLTKQQQQELFRHQAAIAELLRHFWACFPARTPQLEAKVQSSNKS